jgi:Ca2+-binding EF-hand superfamily protein
MKIPAFLILFLTASLALSQSPPASSDVAGKQKQKLEKRFSKLDLNNDSFVDRDEFNKSRQAQKKASRAEKRFSRTDTNSDGKLSKDEWLSVPARKGKAKNTSA